MIGVLFLVATAAYMAGSEITGSVLKRLDLVQNLLSFRSTLIVGILLESINIIAVVSIGVLLIPFVKPQNMVIAIGYTASRIIEAVLLSISEIGLLALIPLSGTVSSVANAQFIIDFILQSRVASFNLAMLSLGIGSLFLCYLFFVSRLIPRILSIVGLVGYLCLLGNVVLGMFAIDTGLLLFLPGAIFELAFPLFLFIKGFNKSPQIRGSQ